MSLFTYGVMGSRQWQYHKKYDVFFIATRAITHHLLHIQVLLSCAWLDYDGKRRLRLSLSRSEADRGWVLTVSLSETSIKWRGRSVPHNRAESAMLGADDAGYRVAKHPKTRTSLPVMVTDVLLCLPPPSSQQQHYLSAVSYNKITSKY